MNRKEEYDSYEIEEPSDEERASSRDLPGPAKKQRNMLTNDELLYDPEEDDRDQAWVDAKRKEYRSRRRPISSAQRRNQSQPLPSSDAILNCPACMTTLCLDCQRHEKYRTQYRAMFVMNCMVDKDEVLRYKAAKQKKQRRKKIRPDHVATSTEEKSETEAKAGLTDSRLSGMDEEEIYHPVKCTECSTEVAVYDKDEKPEEGAEEELWRTRQAENMALGDAWKQISWFYYQYLLVTALYMLEPWERTIFNSLLVSVAAMAVYTGFVFMPQHIMAILHYFEVIQ
ncbi:hypothetical protein HF521_021536 [Silurus meridionalis]|uniref:Uncharacterized protein n=2 Tax=Silurus TaxID=94992 RepID=A0A8T0BBL5_SILME|nr:hypothetical protein HF521_021536 [Silurus meridionalis]